MTIKKYATAKGVDFKYAKGKTDIYGSTFHNRFEIYLLLGGNVSLITDSARIHLQPYQLAVIPPEQFHQFMVEGNVEDYERCVLNLDVDFMDSRILKDALEGKELLNLTSDGRIVQNILYLKEQIDSRKEEELSYILPAIATDLVFCIKTTLCSDGTSAGEIGKLSQEIINYINFHYTEDVDLNTLAKTFHVSVSSLCHLFKQEFGITIKQYVVQKRLNSARFALNRGDKAEEVCRKVGFTNYSAFFRLYKKQFGTSPSRKNELL